MATLKVKIDRIRQEAIDIKSFRLAPAQGAALPPFTPGSHIDVHVAPGLIRQYSLCNGPEDAGAYAIAVKREAESRGGSHAMHDSLREGDEIQIGEPRNNFRLVPDASHHVLVAGGIGVTPLLSMARHLAAAGASFELQYFTRSIQHAAFHDVLSAAPFAGKVHFHYAVDPEAVRAYLRRHLWHRPDNAHLYLCGPRPFMDLVETTAQANWPPETVHLEYFAADPASLAGPRDSFIVRCARAGVTCEVSGEQSIVQALLAKGFFVETSCEQGVCGTCLTGVLEGVPDHRDVFLTDEERAAGDKIMPCVSRSRSEVLVLDL